MFGLVLKATEAILILHNMQHNMQHEFHQCRKKYSITSDKSSATTLEIGKIYSNNKVTKN